MDEIIKDDSFCFACGKENPIGLHLDVQYDENGASVVDYTVKKEYQGYAGIVHGGIISLMLDELQVYAAGGKGLKTVTAKIEVKFVRTVKTGIPVTIKAQVINIIKGSWVETNAGLYQEGKLKAKSKALLRVII